MAAISDRFGAGGANMQPGGSNGSPDLATALRDLVDDITEVRGKVITLAAKLDADSGVGDTNYVATCSPAAMKSSKA